jgi:hypothetical protein
MKTIRLIVLAALLLPALVSHAQTKEETIEWLKEKLGSYIENPYKENYSYRNLKLVSINECEIVISFEEKYSGNYWPWCFTLPTTGFKIDGSGEIKYDNKVVRWDEKLFSNHLYQVRIASREENIYERIQKAINHLATFCPKKTEAF